MAMAMRVWKLIVAVVVVAAVVADAQPVSRIAPYTVTITAGKTPRSLVVIKTQNYIVALEGSPCAITVRHLFSNELAHLLWTANYYAGSPFDATKCTLNLTSAGDLQLLALVNGVSRTLWRSNSAGKGVVKMALENKFDSGDLRLLTAKNVIKFRSFDVKEFAILPTQKFRPGETLVARRLFAENIPQSLFSGRRYFLELQGGDLALFSNFGKGLKQYWSLKMTLAKNVDLSKVAYASIVTSVGGIGLFTNNNKVVWTSGKISIITSNPHDTYFRVDPDGNLRTYALVKGTFWSKDFEAITNICDLPNACGQYGVCMNGKCGCLPLWFHNDPRDFTKGCTPLAPMKTCGSGQQALLSFSGYDQVYNKFAQGLQISKAACEARCYGRQPNCDNSCSAYFYNANTRTCYLTNEVHTLQKVADSKKTFHVRL